MAIHCGRAMDFSLGELVPTSLIQTHVLCESCSFPLKQNRKYSAMRRFSLKLKKSIKLHHVSFFFFAHHNLKIGFSNTLTCSPNSTSTFLIKSWNMYDLYIIHWYLTYDYLLTTRRKHTQLRTHKISSLLSHVTNTSKILLLKTLYHTHKYL